MSEFQKNLEALGELLPLPTTATAVVRRNTPTTPTFVVAQEVANPRDPNIVWQRAEVNAKLLGADAWYSLPVGGRPVEGATRQLAECLAQCWGNCQVSAALIEERPDGVVVIEAKFVDLETGFTLIRTYRTRLAAPRGKFSKDPDRWFQMQFDSAQSKALRGVILRSLPAWLVREALEAARRSAGSDLLRGRSLTEARQMMLQALVGMGASPEELDNYVGRPLAQWTQENCVELSAQVRAIKRGELDLATMLSDTRERMAMAKATLAAPDPLAALQAKPKRKRKSRKKAVPALPPEPVEEAAPEAEESSIDKSLPFGEDS